MNLAIEEIVAGGLCIGCGLCVSIAGTGRVQWILTPEGRERPVTLAPLDAASLDTVNAVCPGRRVEGARPGSHTDQVMSDPVWGYAERLSIGFAADPHVRHHGSSGGLLTALGQYLLSSGRARFIVHVSASREQPLRTTSRLSFDAVSVLEAAGSRYGPAAPLIDFVSILERGESFALIAKPCDIAAVRNLAKRDPRVDRYLTHALTFSCGGASDLTKSEHMLEQVEVHADEVSLFKYRGDGNPGPTRIETKDGRRFELRYQQVWEDENQWMLQARCKICPDAIGESADLVATDVWPGGGPSGEDAGFNGIIVRTARGLELYEAAVAAGAIRVEPHAVGFRDLDRYQPHQVRKKRAVGARLAAMRAAGRVVPETQGLRLEQCARALSEAERRAEYDGTLRRIQEGRLGEPRARPRSSHVAHELLEGGRQDQHDRGTAK